jgi:Flp pilus assembly protein TadG
MSIPFLGRFKAMLETWRSGLAKIGRNTEGATAVEFAIVAAPFFALLVAILDVALLSFAQAELQTGVDRAQRQIMTGQTAAAGLTQTQFQQLVCTYLPSFTCSGVMVDLETINSFSSANTSTPTFTFSSGTASPSTPFVFVLGGPSAIQVLRVMYFWPVFPGPLNLNFANVSNGARLLMAAAVFRNEPQ